MNATIFIIQFVLIVVCLLMVLIVLMQRPKQEGLGASFGAGVTDQIWGAQTTNVLQKFTVRLAILFFLLSMLLCFLKARQDKKEAGGDALGSLPTEKVEPKKPDPAPASPTANTVTIPATPAPVTPATPAVTPPPAPEPKTEGTPAEAPKSDSPPPAEATPPTPPPAAPPAPAAPAPPAAPTPAETGK